MNTFFIQLAGNGYGYEQCAKNEMIFEFAASQNFCSLIFNSLKSFGDLVNIQLLLDFAQTQHCL
jgi:hypothetical protein